MGEHVVLRKSIQHLKSGENGSYLPGVLKVRTSGYFYASFSFLDVVSKILLYLSFSVSVESQSR
jgi:hypothetical protein